MEDKLLEITDMINRHVWDYWKGPRREEALIISKPTVAFPRLKVNLELLKRYSNLDEEVKDLCFKEIRDICYGENLPEDIKKNTTLDSEFTQDIILGEVNKGLDLLQTLNSSDIIQLEKEFKKKWLYFEGEESGSAIIWITRISYKSGTLVWSGLLIELMTENSSVGIGVAMREVDEEDFYELPYYDDEIKTTQDLQNWLQENGEELDWKEAKKRIHDQISYGFSGYNDSVSEKDGVPDIWN